MGIHGLTSYVGNNCHFFIDTKLKNTNIIIDGNSLYHHLYFNYGIDKRHGGDYDMFADLARSFFKKLFLCHINPYVVLDGGCDYTDKKFATLKLRAKDRIRVAHSIAEGSNGSVLPLLTREVFKTVLFQLEIPFVQCLAEADWEIASLANQWNCPVLTMDSDFCIFDLKGGYYPLNDFNWRSTSKDKDNSEFYIPALCFSIDKFCAHFNHMNKALLPLLAVISGNDYVNIPAMENFFSQVIFPLGNVRNAKRNNRIHNLLNWLSRFEEPGEALEKVLEYLVDSHKDEIRKCLCAAMEEYKLSDSHLAEFFTKGTPLSKVPVAMDMLPDWVVVALGKGKLAPYIIDVLVLQRVCLVTQVEDSQLPSSHMCSLPIRQVMYGLLLNGRNPSKVGKGSQGKNKGLLVEEYCRHDLTLVKSQVKAVLTSSSESLSLEAIAEVSLAVRLKILLETLGVKPCIVDAVSSHLILPVAVTCYWLTHSAPKPKLMQLQALLMGIVYGELRRLECDAGPRGPTDDVKIACDRLWRMRVRQTDMDIKLAHIFCQWQACIHKSLYLNQLLCNPLQQPDISWLYSGTFVHQVFRELKQDRSPDFLLSGCTVACRLFKDILSAVLSNVPADFFRTREKKAKEFTKQQKDGRSKERRGDTEEPLSWRNINNRFSLLLTDDE
ncbi:hypothetical protein AOXY_G3684 [Acipenser oxyrinchus oxyrinchus]|uniref:Asteroid domain-containing protein n=1 Tax=Acipenser oxyrinchus oxyrinchus TaxID=40147 RepID=A0AAD8GG60_ACIOX|nr:hypothetical protein AOXY_G3684 [Acipenser oxyrinchus oxyrinchus]